MFLLGKAQINCVLIWTQRIQGKKKKRSVTNHSHWPWSWENNFLRLAPVKVHLLLFIYYKKDLQFIKNILMLSIYGSHASISEGELGLRVGDAGLRIKSSMIRIPSRPDSIVDYDTYPIPMTILSLQSKFQYKFDNFSIKVNLFLFIFYLLNKIRSKLID